MLRDDHGRPLGDHWRHHGHDVETVWDADVPHLTANERFFVRNHSDPPVIDPRAWRLLVSGDGVIRDVAYSLADLRAFTSHTYERALECTGNGRSLFATQQGTPRPGTPWQLGAIGVARWTGVPLATLLRHAGLRPEAVSVTAVGLDASYVEDGVDHGRVRRPLPLAKALDDTLVALEMNGEPLPLDHGFPARLVVPGWVGIASIKWLGELRVTTRVEDSPWNTRWYRMHGAGWSGADAELGRMPVKGVLDRIGDGPGSGRPGEVEPAAGVPTVLHGRAWSGEACIERVEVSTDGGATWRPAALHGPNERSAWTAWSLPWTPGAAGGHTVLVRATDTDGRTQPDVAADNDDGYLFGAVVRYPVEVRAPEGAGLSGR